MFNIERLDHIGIRISAKQRAVDFYQSLGFKLLVDTGFEKGHPVMMEHPAGVVLNLLGPANGAENQNILMDIESKHTGYTHMALKVDSLNALEDFLQQNKIEITGQFAFKGMRALFIRDPDRNVIEFDEYAGDQPGSRKSGVGEDNGYHAHP